MSFDPPHPFNIYDYFLGNRVAGGAGDRRALLTDQGSWSYAEVHQRSGRMASLLEESGVEPGDRVLIALHDGPDYVAALFGILRMGGVVVMVNPHLPVDQIRYFYDYTTPRAALVAHDVVDAFVDATASANHAPDVTEVGTEDFAQRLSSASPEVDVYPSGADDPAIFLFSGGTTGNPKAVVQTHRSFANTTELYGRGVLGLSPDDVTLSVPKLYFGYATGSNLFFPFSVGATVALFPERCTAETLFDKIEAFRPTLLVNVPTMVNHLVSHGTAGERDLSSLRLSTSAGEALPVELHRRWDETFGVPLLDGLGTAEMWHIFISNRPDDVRPGTLGRPVEGFDVRACDAEGKPVPAGEVGIMRVRGDSLALGYWKNREKTAEAFQDGWYVSGDMISFDEDGYVTYAGRADDMLKVSGKWLSPRELENCLLEHDAVGEAAVVGARTADGLVKPAAFVVPAEGVSGDEALGEELKGWAKSRLEPYKYPRAVVFRDSLPRTHLGKVDRGELARSLEGLEV
ncbi:MAG: benzoate-CoA ligase family protein [Longimicrobiales bacterium]|nr:benzoate-CoA ligase family protein [Longimicrobiales bacterium]